MKSINELTEITRVQSGGVFAVNNAEDTVTNKITIENLTSQIASAVEHDVNLVIGNSSNSTTDSSATNSNVHINLIENNTVDSSHSILGGGNISVTSDSNGDITISGSGTWDTAYAHSQVTSGNPHNVTASDVGLGNVGNFKAVSTIASQGLSSTEQANARANIGANASQPFNLALDGTTYGYLKTDGTTFVAFKSQADIDAAVAAAKVGNAAAEDVLSGKTFTNSTTSGVSGSMTNNGAVSPSGLNCGGSYTIPAGYHNGSGVVTANSLSSQTGVDSGKTAVTAAAMLSGYQGWVNGSKISGTMSSKAAATYNTSTSDQTISASQYLSGAQTIKAVTTANIAAANIKTGVTITVGDANSSTRIANVAGTFTAANTVSSGQTAAAAGQLLTGYSAWVGGSEIKGSMANQGAKSTSLNCGGSYTIPAGYHNGSGVISANSLASQTGVDSGKTAVTAAAMLSGYQGWVNGSKISGTMSSKAAATYNTSTSDQTISASQYLSGAQTIKAVKTANIAAANIKTGVTITVGDANSATRIANVAGTFTAANTVSSGQTAAAAGQILTGYSAWVGGSEIKGSIANRQSNSMIVPRWGTSPGSNVPATQVATRNPRVDFGNTTTYGSAEMIEIAMPAGLYAWSYGNSSCCIPTETKSVTAGTSATTVTPTEYNTSAKYVKFLKSVTVNPTPSQSKSASCSTSAQTISPDSGKLLSSVSIAAITPQRSAGTAATTSGIDSTGPYVYFPYGWWPNANTTYGCYTRMTAAQAVAACPSQTKSASTSTSTQYIKPDTGKLLSQVTIYPSSGTLTLTKAQANTTVSCLGYANVNCTNPWKRGIEEGVEEELWCATAGTDALAKRTLKFDLTAGGTITFTNTDVYNGTIHLLDYVNIFDINGTKLASYAIVNMKGKTITYTVPSGKTVHFIELYVHGMSAYKDAGTYITVVYP